jgi:molybdenum cofactor synthesis domain-containing protein
MSWLENEAVRIVQTAMVPDEIPAISEQLKTWADSRSCDLILTTGGTGVSPRDVTPEATSSILDRVLPGYGELMRMKSLEKTPMAIISRALAGIRKECLIINLPGSPKAAIENLQAVWPAVGHTIEKIQGDDRDCAERFD